MKRKTRILVSLVGLVALAAGGCNISFVTSSGGYNFDWKGDTHTRSEAGVVQPDVNEIVVQNHFGEINIETAEGEPTWKWELQCWGHSRDEAEAWANEILLQVETSDGQQRWALVLPDPPVKRLRGVQSDLTLFVPPDVDVATSNRFGSTTVRDIAGKLVARNEHGDVDVEAIGGEVDLNCSYGVLKASRLALGGLLENRHGAVDAAEVDGSLTVRTSYEPATIRQVAGRVDVTNEHGSVTIVDVADTVRIRTSHDFLEVEGVEGDAVLMNEHGPITATRMSGSIEAETCFDDLTLSARSSAVRCRNEHGNINLELQGDGLEQVEAATSFADLRITLPPAATPRIDAKTSHGEVDSEFSARADDERGPRVKLRNEHGDIKIRRGSAE